MNNISNFSKCANCGACYNICPADVITVENGVFYNLKIDYTKCMNCGLCKEVCPINNFHQKQNLHKAYGAFNTDCDIVKLSSSGGVFSAIAEYVLERDGIVYGAAYSDDYKSVKIYSTEETNIDNIRRSKYVESQVGTSFRDVKQKLNDGKLILYCGAPCQIAGLKSFLKNDYENLITCDFSCGGMPSNKLYKEYIEHIQKKLNRKIDFVNFRPKTYGWMQHAIKICGETKKYLKWAFADPYFYCFIENRYSIRDYCYECQFADNHYSDIILADLWKCNDISNIKNDDTGLSLVISNSSKGDDLLNTIKTLSLTVLNLEKASYNMKQKLYSDDFFERRKSFLRSCNDIGFIETMKSVKLRNELIFKLKHYIKRLKNILIG